MCNNDLSKGREAGKTLRRYYAVMAIYERLAPWRQKECILVNIEWDKLDNIDKARLHDNVRHRRPTDINNIQTI